MYRVVSVQYFMDVMDDYEVDLYLDNIPYLDVNQWEQTRFLGYCSVQMFSKKKLTPTDLLTFEWEAPDKGEIEISNSDIQRLKEKSEQYSKLLNRNGEKL